jgi:hypothetical protein
MIRFVSRVRHGLEIRKLQRLAPRDPTPRTTTSLCRILEGDGRFRDAVECAREGLKRFPHARELEDILRRSYARPGTGPITTEKAEKGDSPDMIGLCDVVQAYLDFARLEDALRASNELKARFPNEPRAVCVHGLVLKAIFLRDHLSKDGKEALEALRRAVALDPTSFRARYGLAETYSEIGATSQALFHLMLALETQPTDPAANLLYSKLKSLPFQRRAEEELLWEAEINDQSLVEKQQKPLDRSFQDQISDDVSRLSRMLGVRRVVARHHGMAVVASGGMRVPRSQADMDGFLNSVEQLRKAASTCTKRLGMGRFEEATMIVGGLTVFAVAAGGSVIALQLTSYPELDEIVEEARNVVATWTGNDHHNMEWVR